MIENIPQEQVPSSQPVINQPNIWLPIVMAFMVIALISSGAVYLWQQIKIKNLQNQPTLSVPIQPSQTEQESYASGEVLVTLKPYTSKDVLQKFVNSYSEISIEESNPISLPTFGTLSLKPYSEWQKKVTPSQKDIPEVRQEISSGEAKLREIYGRLKTSSILDDSNFWSSFYSSIEPEKNYFAVIHYFLKGSVTKDEQNNFFKQFSELEIVENNDESKTYTVIVPTGKEKYWLSEFQKQDFVKVAWLNKILHLN